MKRYITTDLTTEVRQGDTVIVPDLKGVGGIVGSVRLAASATECLVLVVRDQGPLDTLKGKSGVKHHGDATREVGPGGGTIYRIPANVRAALVAEAARLGAGADFRPEGYDVGG